MIPVTSEKRDIILTKINEAKRSMGAIRKASVNPFHKSKYAALPAFIEATEDALDQCGLILYACLGEVNGKETLITTIEHIESGQWMRSYAPLLNAKGDSQGMGSSITYMRRYSMGALLNLCPEEDDDGNKACAPASPKKEQSPKPPAPPIDKISQEEVKVIYTLLKSFDQVSYASFFEWIKKEYKVSVIADLPKAAMEKCLNLINAKIKYFKDQERGVA